MTMEFRRMRRDDLAAILRIQAANYVGNLAPEQRVRGMFEQLKREMAGRFDAGAALIAEDNLHSMYIHATRLGMSSLGDFEYQGKRFTIVAFAI